MFSRPRRSGFTVVELLVVLGVTMLLVSLLIPAVQKVRATADLMICGNNLRQIGIALHAFHGDHDSFPTNGGWDGVQQIRSTSGNWFVPATHDYDTGKTWQWGVGDPRKVVRNQTGSWLYSILPYVEQEGVHQQQQWTSALKIHTCPARRSPTARPAVDDNYGWYRGGGWEWGRTDYAGNGLLFFGRLNPTDRVPLKRFADITDGTATTILAGEKAMAPNTYDSGTWYWDEGFFLGGSGGTTRTNPILFPDRFITQAVQFKNNWGSAHASGVQFLFADGSVRLQPFLTETRIIQAIFTPNGGEVVSLD